MKVVATYELASLNNIEKMREAHSHGDWSWMVEILDEYFPTNIQIIEVE